MDSLFVIDISSLVERVVVPFVMDQTEKPIKIIVPEIVVSYLESRAHENVTSAIVALDELKALSEISSEKLTLEFSGHYDGKPLSAAAINSYVRNLAKIEDATLITGDRLQAEISMLKGIKTLHLKASKDELSLSFEKLFDEETMSLHFREGVKLYAKKGRPGAVKIVVLRDQIVKKDEIEQLIREIISKTTMSTEAFIEIEAMAVTVVQFKNYRIAIATPPFSDAYEITIVKPIKKFTLEEYNLEARLLSRLQSAAEGILIAGPPGAGKSTFAQALAEYYSNKEKIVKTMEAPRDLQVLNEISQYAPLEGDFEKTSDILLLVRPDYTIFDELRKTSDFQVYSDMRLAGVGMVGVTHSSTAIDAIQRFLGRVDLGILPQIIDTVIFIKDGIITKVYELEMTVKVPTGMTEADLARPVVEIRDFFSKKVEYEIYTYGEETTVVPVEKIGKESLAFNNFLKEKIMEEFQHLIPEIPASVSVQGKRVIMEVPKHIAPHLLKKHKYKLALLEKKIGMRVDIRRNTSMSSGGESPFTIKETKKFITFVLPQEVKNKELKIHANGVAVVSSITPKTNKIRIYKKGGLGQVLLNTIHNNKEIKIFRV